MRKRITIMLVMFLGALATLILFHLLFDDEPEYRDRKLSVWFKQYYRSGQWSRHSNDAQHDRAARALRGMGTNAIPFLVTECFTINQESPFQTNLLTLLAELPKPFRFPPFVPNMSVREEAASAIGEIRPSANLLLPLVTNRLNDPDKFQRWMATYLLGRIGEGGEAAVPFLREKLRSTDAQESTLAALSLDRLGPAVRLAVPDLIEFVRTNSSHSIYYACRALARVGPAASNALPVLKEKLSSETNVWKQVNFAMALICIDSQQVEAMGILRAELADTQKTNTQRNVISAMRDIGTNARPTLPLLLTAVKDKDPLVWHPALYVLLSLGETNLAISSAEEKLEDVEPVTRYNATTFLLELQPTNAVAMAALIQLVQAQEWSGLVIREAKRLGSDAQPMIPTLRQIAVSKTNSLRYQAQEALADIEAAVAEEREAR